MRTTAPLLLGLLLASAPAWAGNDFCDSMRPVLGGGGGLPEASIEDPKGGECKSTLTVTSTLQTQDRAYWRIRNLPYTARNQNVLRNFGQLMQMRLHLNAVVLPQEASLPTPGAPVGPKGESTFLEWSFHPKNALDLRERVLILTAVRNDQTLYLRGDWVQPQQSGWSVMDKDRNDVHLISSSYLALGPVAPFRPIQLTLLREDARIRVGLGESPQKWIDFDASDTPWEPSRLRTGLLQGTPLNAGEGLELFWPYLPYRSLFDQVDGIELPPSQSS